VLPSEVLGLCREHDVKAVDLRFVDLLGAWQHTTKPVRYLTIESFEDGLGFDGSNVRGWQSVNESDMLLMPQTDTAFIDPFTKLPTLSIICNVHDPITTEAYSRDPRNVATKAQHYLRRTGIADSAAFGPEAEFFVFDDVRFDQRSEAGYYFLDSDEAQWNRGTDTRAAGRGPNLGHRMRERQGYFPTPPNDHGMDLRNEMMQMLGACNVEVECHHHEVGGAGQAEIDVRYDTLVNIADKLMIYKYVVKNVARMNGKSATFMPKPLHGEPGSGMHTHFSLWNEESPLFAGDNYAGLSDTALYAIGGLLKHAHAVLAFTNPTTNSYKRLAPGTLAPVNLAYSQRNRSAACRIPMYSQSPDTKRVEFRCPDPSCNPYLAFAAMLMAAIDGIQNKISPGDPLDKDIYDLPPEEATDVPQTPATLEAALDALEADHEFLLRGEVFTPDVIETWLRIKRKDEAEEMSRRPHPYEFCLYYDV